MKKIASQVRRYDVGELSAATRTPQGFLKCQGFATRTGVFPYVRKDGSIRRELRHPEDVFAPESLATLQNAPVTIEHPPEMINTVNVKDYRKGHVTDHVMANRDLVEIELIVEDQDAIDEIEKNGMRELSSGYAVDLVEESGEYEGAPYDYRQTNIRYNHQAIVSRGRAGPEIRLRLDSADALMQDGDVKENEFTTETSTDSDIVAPELKKVVIMGEEVDLPSHLADVVQDMLDRQDEFRNKLAKLEADMSTKARKDNGADNLKVSPQVDVQQAIKDGRAAPAKVAPSGKADTEEMDEEEKAKADADEEKAKKDAEEEAKKDAEEEAKKTDAEAMKKDVEDLKKKLDAAQGKLDEYQSATLNKKQDADKEKEKMDSANTKALIRARVKLERQAEQIVPAEVSDKFDSMTDDEVRMAVITHTRPGTDLKGKSSVYLESRFDSIVESFEDESSERVRKDAGSRLMDTHRKDSGDQQETDPDAARLKMIQGGRELYKQPLSRSKKTN